MDLYDVWIDGDGEIHRISDMDDSYIQNCLRQLYKWKSNWSEITLEELSTAEKKRVADTGMKAWFVINGQKYIDVLEREMQKRT